MEKQPTVEELLSTIKLLTSTLEFYADEKNYADGFDEIAGSTPAITSLDEGALARTILDQIKHISDYERQLVEDYSNMIDQMFADEEHALDDEEYTRSQKLAEFVSKLDNFKNKHTEND